MEPASPVELCRKPEVERRCIDSARLFEGQRELEIDHYGDVYLLRVTRNGKLILTK